VRIRVVTGKRLKKILVFPSLDGDVKPGQSRFIDHKCPVNQCTLTGRHEDAATADMIMFNGYLTKFSFARPRDQIWVLFMLESPYHTPSLAEFDGLVNIRNRILYFMAVRNNFDFSRKVATFNDFCDRSQYAESVFDRSYVNQCLSVTRVQCCRVRGFPVQLGGFCWPAAGYLE
jgi:hypothetical protein